MILYDNFHMIESYTGFHSVITTGTFPGKDSRYIEKAYGKKGVGYEMDRAKRAVVLQRRFQDIARSIGVPTGELVGHYITNNHHPDRVTLVETQVHAGRNLQDLITSGEPVDDLLKQYLEAYGKVWSAGSPISLDPVPANFCVDPEGVLRYVDYMPPRQQLDDGSYVSEWPDPPEDAREYIERRYFTPEGQIPVMYAQLLRAFAKRPEDARGDGMDHYAIRDLMNANLGSEAVEIVDRGIQDLYTRPLTPHDSDFIRIHAAEQFFDGTLSADDMNQVFHLTHIGAGGILEPVENMNEAFGILRNTSSEPYAYGDEKTVGIS